VPRLVQPLLKELTMSRPSPSIVASVLTLGAAALLSACASSSHDMTAMQQGVPDAVKVPAGHQVALRTVGVGEITYECRAAANPTAAATWVFVGPQADLNAQDGRKLGTYFGPPATWASADGSKITGKQLAVSPGGAGNIPFQLVQANPAMGEGAMNGVTYVQRLATRGGVAPALPCDGASIGRKAVVQYQADYLFWKRA
jgi:hypothetical protein